MISIKIWIQEVWQYRELLYFFVWREIKVRYRQTLLGGLWAILQPVFMMVVFTLFFGNVAKIPSDGLPYPIFFYSGLLPWLYFSSAVANAGTSLVNNADLITKVYFPRVLIPASAAITGLLDLSIASVLLFAMMAYYRIALSIEMLLWPVLISFVALLAFAIGLFLSALAMRYRDVKYAIPFAVQIGLFVTPVIYPASLIPERFQVLLALNPLTGVIEGCRAALLPTRSVDWMLVCGSVVAGLVFLVLSAAYFRTTERSFADIV